MFQEEGGRVNVDSSTKAAAAAEGSEEHGKRAKVKCTSGGQVQGHCRCLPFNRLAPPPQRHALAAFRLAPDLLPLRPAELSRHRRGEGGSWCCAGRLSRWRGRGFPRRLGCTFLPRSSRFCTNVHPFDELDLHKLPLLRWNPPQKHMLGFPPQGSEVSRP